MSQLSADCSQLAVNRAQLAANDAEFSVNGAQLAINRTLLESSSSRKQYCAWFIHIRTIKHHMVLNIIGGFAFLALGKILFHSALLCLVCNIAATQMLHYVLPAAQ